MPYHPPSPAPVNNPVKLVQEQGQGQEQQVNNSFNPVINDSNTNTTESNSSNNSDQISSLSNITIQPSDPTYFTYGNGVSLPGNSLTLSGTTNLKDDSYITLAYTHNFGRRGYQKAFESINIYNLAERTELCASIIRDGLVVDYALQPELEYCGAFKPSAPLSTEPTRSSELAETKKMLEDLIKLNKDQQNTIQALTLRLEQIKHVPAVVPALF
jgi:hypothetical protein